MPETVNVTIGSLHCVCVPLADADFKDVAAIYIIICVVRDNAWFIIDIGQSGHLGTRIDGHDRKECWRRECPNGTIWVCAYPMPSATEQQRVELERQLRIMYRPSCGKR
jgi:hypothetical protein